MWFRSLDGNLKEINRKDFVSCKDYYNSVSKIIMTINYKENSRENTFDHLINLIKNK